MAEIYTGSVTLSYYVTGSEKDGYQDVLTLEAFSETKAEVLRKLFLNTFMVADFLDKETAKPESEGLRWYFSFVYPSLTHAGNGEMGSGGSVENGHDVVHSAANTILFMVERARTEIFGEKTSGLGKVVRYWNLTIEEVRVSILELINLYGEDFAVAVEDGRWKRHLRSQQLRAQISEEARRSRVETRRAKELNDARDVLSVDKRELRSRILKDEDTSFGFKIFQWFRTL